MPTLRAPAEGEVRIACAAGAADPIGHDLPPAVLARVAGDQDGRPWR
jgi:hypothetical protein